MEWGEGDQWLLTLDLPPGAAQFKLVAAPAKAGRGGAEEWEAGPNRDLQVPQAPAHGAVTVVCEWSHTADSLEAPPAEELETLPAGLAAPAAEQEPKGAGAWGRLQAACSGPLHSCHKASTPPCRPHPVARPTALPLRAPLPPSTAQAWPCPPTTRRRARR